MSTRVEHFLIDEPFAWLEMEGLSSGPVCSEESRPLLLEADSVRVFTGFPIPISIGSSGAPFDGGMMLRSKINRRQVTFVTASSAG